MLGLKFDSRTNCIPTFWDDCPDCKTYHLSNVLLLFFTHQVPEFKFEITKFFLVKKKHIRKKQLIIYKLITTRVIT